MINSSSASPTTSRIAIFGAGLAGLSAALFLDRLNLPVTIYESRPRDTSDGGSIALAPNAAYILDQLGVYQQLLAKGFPYEEITFLSSRNYKKIATILNGGVKRYGYPALKISRHALRQTLLEKVLEAGIEVKFEHKLTGSDETRRSGSLTFSTISNTATRTHTKEPIIHTISRDEPLQDPDTGISQLDCSCTLVPDRQSVSVSVLLRIVCILLSVMAV